MGEGNVREVQWSVRKRGESRQKWAYGLGRTRPPVPPKEADFILLPWITPFPAHHTALSQETFCKMTFIFARQLSLRREMSESACVWGGGEGQVLHLAYLHKIYLG